MNNVKYLAHHREGKAHNAYYYLKYEPASTIMVNRVKGLAAYWGFEEVVYAIRVCMYEPQYSGYINSKLRVNVEQMISHIGKKQLEIDFKEIFCLSLDEVQDPPSWGGWLKHTGLAIVRKEAA